MPIFQSPVKSAILKGTAQGGSIRQFFGENPEDYNPIGLAWHNGLDIATFKGDACLAVASGRIFNTASIEESSQQNLTKFNGNVVWLLTNPIKDRVYLCAYGHLDSISVKNGQIVKAGDEIGKEGNTGFVVSDTTRWWGNAPANLGTHCHFGTYELIEGDDGYGSFNSGGKLWHIANPDNGTKGAVNPLPLLVDDNELRIPLLTQLANLYRALIRSLGGNPVA